VTRRRHAHASRPGFSLIEATLAILLVGVVLAGALQTVAASRASQRLTADRARAQQLALDLVNEILTQAYTSAAGPGKPLGREAGKSSANRSQLTDVDDYADWTETPPRDRSGNPIAGAGGWTRAVTVTWADPATLAPTKQPDTGLKVITVTVSRAGVPRATLTAYRSAAWVDTIPSSSDATNRAPIAVASASRTSDSKRLDTTLDGSGSSDQDADALSYVWSFGDGASAQGSRLTHSYTTPGVYTATLTVYDGRGGVASASVVLTVKP
jgi:Tfp pilus assembly protein PilW